MIIIKKSNSLNQKTNDKIKASCEISGDGDEVSDIKKLLSEALDKIKDLESRLQEERESGRRSIAKLKRVESQFVRKPFPEWARERLRKIQKS